MGYLGSRNQNDLVFQFNGQELKVGTPATGVFETVIADNGVIEDLTVTNLTVVSGASLPSFTSLIVQPTGTSQLDTVTQGTWNGDVLEEIYGGTNQSSYAPGDLLYASGVDSLATLPSGVEGSHLEILAGVLAWTPHTAPLGDVLIGTAATVNPTNIDKYVMVSGVGLVTVNLPGSPAVGQEHHVKDRQGIAASSGITVDGNGGLIDGATTSVINTNYGSIHAVWDGAQWNLL
jgi:hypothetical protein